jgi:flagellar assembly protein FliH
VEALDAGRSGASLSEFTPAVIATEELDPDVEQPELSEEEQQAQMLAQLQMQAHEQGYNAGLNEGRQKGHEQGYQEGLAKGLEHGIDQARQQQAPIHARMQQLVSEFQHTLDALDSVIASRLMQMALEAARQVIGQTPVVDNTALIKQIQGLLQQEPLFSGNRSCASIRTTCSALKRAWARRSTCTAGVCAAIRRYITAAAKSLPMKAIWMPASPPAGRNCAAWRHRESSDDRTPHPLAHHARQL